MAAYALLADLQMVMPTTAFSGIPTATTTAILNARNAFADDKMRARYRLPLAAPYPASLTQNICFLAAYDVMCFRGYNPQSGADQNIRARYLDAMKWFDDVERQRCHPAVTEAAAPGTTEYDAPLVLSKPRQGWEPGTADDPDFSAGVYPSWTRPQ